jgi:hypothetical protein
MKVKELIEKLSKLDQESNVFISGYEGGYNDVTDCSESVEIVRDVHEEWYYGKHELRLDLSDYCEISNIDVTDKVIDTGYIIC